MLKIFFGYVLFIFMTFMAARLACYDGIGDTIKEENKYQTQQEISQQENLRLFTNQFYIDTVNDIILKYAKEGSNGAIVIPPEDARILRQRLSQFYNQLNEEEKEVLEKQVDKIIILIK